MTGRKSKGGDNPKKILGTWPAAGPSGEATRGKKSPKKTAKKAKKSIDSKTTKRDDGGRRSRGRGGIKRMVP